jgi:hypothetical protein
MDADASRGAGLFAIQKDLKSPLAGLAAVRLEGYVGGGTDGAEGGARLVMASPAGRVHTGIDIDARTGDVDWLIGTDINVRRGGIFGGGSRLRLEWLPTRDQTVRVGVIVPVGQRAGVTRPRADKARQPVEPHTPRPAAVGPAVVREFRAAAEATARLAIPLHSRMGDDPVAAVAKDVAAVRLLDTPERMNQRMMAAWRGLFAAALALTPAVPADTLDAVTRLGRRAVLEDVLLPFAGLVGQRRTPAGLEVFAPKAARRFDTDLQTVAGLGPAQRHAAAAALLSAVRELDGVRRGIREGWHSDRRVFLPLQVALPPEEADTQEELDALLERASGGRFSHGNHIYYVINEAFQFEFAKTVRRAERYHVLWIHDVRGASATAPVDRVGAAHVVNYLDTMTARVRQYDTTGSLPQYFIILDQYFYEANNGRLWMTLLEDPLGREVSLPPAFADEQQHIEAALRNLRDAVAASTALQAGRSRFGDTWLHNLVKVHVNITHPADFSFWAKGLFPLLGMPDSLMRDHRKIAFYDITEDDPYKGEAMFTGMGIGEHYAGATWEDRALIVQGPAALEVKAALRRLLSRQGAKDREIPAVLLPKPLAADYATRVADEIRRAEAGAVPPARAMQTHNEAGYGTKQVSVVKSLLTSVMPRGSVIIAPDSLWEDHLYGSLLLGSALRGCRVLIIGPALANAPASGWPMMARAHMLFSRLLALSKALDGRISAEGGLFKIGLFNEAVGVGDIAGRISAAHATIKTSGAWFRQLVPFLPETLARWDKEAATLAADRPPTYLVQPADGARPKLHMKGLYAATPGGWDGLFGRPEMTTTLLEYFAQRARQVSGDRRMDVDVRELPRKVWVARRQLLAAHHATLSADQVQKVAYYLQIGSFNMNDRSMLFDGEAAVTVSGPAALTGMLDFVMVAGLSTWVERQEQIDALLPPPSGFKRLLARWGRSAL